ncbi:MAG TPA: hypothetical protein VFG73_02180 [Rhodanobacteraceae bacterium]|nr:hypothetical protein [Rhodanobacteraceae bacterium]
MNPVQYGRLIESVQQLTKQLTATSLQIDGLERRLQEVEGRFRMGRGVLLGLALALGYTLHNLGGMLQGLFK